jgi:hypothetical protein
VLWYLRKVPLLADLGPDAIARMAERVELREARRRDVVYLPGDPGRSLFFVHGGRIKVSKVTRDGKSLTLAYHGPAELFGDSCLLDGGPRSAQLLLSAEDFELVAWRTLGEGMLLIDMYEQWTSREQSDASALGALEEPQVERALQWWKKLRL